MIERNTTIPCRKKEIFTTAADNQTTVTIHVLQGERELAKYNRSLGKFNLEGIPPAPRGVPQIEVTFDIDADGILHVSAKDLATGKEQKIRIEASSGLTEEEIKRMQEEAKKYEEEDKRMRKIIDLRNQLDGLIYNVEKMLRESGEKISPSLKSELNSAIEEGKKKMDSDNESELQAIIDKITQLSHRVAEELYKNASKEGGTTSTSSGQTDQKVYNTSQSKDKSSKENDEVIDAEFEVEDDNK